MANITKNTDMLSNTLSKDDIFQFMDLYFNRQFIMYNHMYNSMNKFFDEDIPQFLENGEHIFFEKITKNKVFRYKFKYENISIKEATLENDIEPMFPSDARNRNLTYSVKLIARVTQIQEIIDIGTGETKINIVGSPEDNIVIASIPVMVRSKYCNLNLYKGYDKSECPYDPGCYFIVNGSEKVIISQDRMVENKPLVFLKKDSGTELYTVQINSRSYKPHGITQIISTKLKKDGNITIRVPILNEVNIFILMRAMGIESDKDITNYICSDETDFDMIDKIRTGLAYSKTDKENIKILTQEQAIDYLSGKLRVLKKYVEGDKNIKTNQKRVHIMSLLENNFLPHIEGNLVDKAYFIGYMINKLLKTSLGRTPLDDRDSYVNKRVDLPGDLLNEPFRQFYRQMLNNCGNFFKKRSGSDEAPLNIINQIKPNTIEQGIKACLLIGAWPRRSGVAQMVQRLTYLQGISFMRRIDAPSGDAASSKIINHRLLHQSSISFLCAIQTPEHAKVGLVKHLALIASVTILEHSQLTLIKNYLSKKIISLQDISPLEIKNMTKVFINGEWIGVTDNAVKLNTELRKNKENGTFNPLVSIIWDIPEKEIRIYCDGGRMYRPVLKVENNQVKLTKDIIKKISLNKADKAKGKIVSWDEFLIENIGIIEFIDMEEQPYLMICDNIDKLEEARKHMYKTIENVKGDESNDIQNRYNEDYIYTKYSHCEFHPSFLIGEIVSIIPFCNHNHGPRNIFLYAQAKQGMGLYTSNYRDRLDISYILYHPQKPLISTRSSRYNNTDVLASGENIVVAISIYTGFNQEDSIVFNLSAIERGLFRSTSLNKEFSQIQKNQSSQDDIFMKPNPAKVAGMKPGSYDKLNDKGYVPEETPIVDGDIIIGKVTPIQAVGNSNKTYKDSSKVYKNYRPGVIDKVYTNIYNAEGYEMRKVRIRSECVPRIGDKFCCYSSDTEVLTQNGWILFKDLNKEIHQVATLLNGNTLSYTKPLDVMNYDFNGNMINIKSANLDLLVTPNHRMWVSDNDNNFKIELAEEIYGKMKRFKKTIENYIPFEQKNVDIPVASESFIESVLSITQEQAKKVLNRILINNTKYYDSVSETQIDQFQILCLHAGVACDIKKIDNIFRAEIITENLNSEYQHHSRISYSGKVYCCQVIGDGVIYVRRNKIPVWCGNSRFGQKGTIGLYLRQSDMPFSKHGITPDIILNSHCIPSRMTLGQILESVMGKSCAIKGVEGDGTPFNDTDIHSIREELTKLGYASSGKEYLYNGMTGKKMNTEIFIGPTYYLRLKHLVEDKFHSRARGPKTSLMHQPPEGRAREGGLRVGEMERDALLAHGLSRYLKEKLMDNSDAYSTYVCDICGLFAQRLFKKDNQSHATPNDLHYCAACKNYTKISKVMIPYAFKLVIQEMMAMNIAPRIRVEQDRV